MQELKKKLQKRVDLNEERMQGNQNCELKSYDLNEIRKNHSVHMLAECSKYYR